MYIFLVFIGLSNVFYATANVSTISEYPSTITLKAGVLIAPPFAMLNEDGEYEGFIPDLLQRLTIFAKKDEVKLKFDLSKAPDQYNSALNLIANDCNTTLNPLPLSDCSKYDLIAGDYYVNEPRSMRVNFSPAWLRTTITTVSKAGISKSSSSTLKQIEASNGTICVPDGTFIMMIVMEKFSKTNFYKCYSPLDCIERLKNDECSQYADDELLLRYRALSDDTLQLNRDNFNTQYLVWPTSYNIDKDVTTLLNKWIYAAIVNTTLDELYNTYFSYNLCPIGTAGENCTDPCHPKYGMANKDGICVCDSTKWTGADCSIEVMHNYNLIPPALKITAYSLYSVLVIVILIMFCWLHRNKDTAQVKSYQPFFLKLVLVGSLISSSAIIVIGIESETHVPSFVCMLGPWLYSIGFSIVFGTLFAKLRRVHLIFQKSSRMMRISITIKETLIKIGIILLVDILLLTVWSIVDPMHWVRHVTIEDKYGDPLSSQAGCTCNKPWIWLALLGALHLSLLVMSSYMCYEARNISTRYSEAKYLRTTIFLNTEIYMIGIPVIIITREDPKARFFVSCIIIMFDVVVVLASLFGGLIYNVVVIGDQAPSMTNALKTYMKKNSMDHSNGGFSNVMKTFATRKSMEIDNPIMEGQKEESKTNTSNNSHLQVNAAANI